MKNKLIIVTFITFFIILFAGNEIQKTVSVSGYTRSSGVHINSYHRRPPGAIKFSTIILSGLVIIVIIIGGGISLVEKIKSSHDKTNTDFEKLTSHNINAQEYSKLEKTKSQN